MEPVVWLWIKEFGAPDVETQVLAWDGERHHLAYVDDEGVWMDAGSDEPVAFEIEAWRHLDVPEEAGR